MNFETKEEITKAVDALMAATANHQRGDTLTWAFIESIIGMRRVDGSGWHIIKQFRTRLRKERRIVCRPIANVGLEMLKGRKAILVPMEDRTRKAFRQTGRAISEVAAADANDLSMHDIQMRQQFIDRSKSNRRQLRRSVKEVTAITHTETLPRTKRVG